MPGLREVDLWFIDRVLPHEKRYVALARRFSRDRSPSSDEARDLVHDVYARLLASEGWRFVDDPRAYVLTMIRNLGIQKLRRARIVPLEALAGVEGSRHMSDAPGPFEETSGRQRLALALQAMKRLPPRCREVVELRRLHDLSARDIARRLGLSLSTVEKRLARGMVLMAEAMRTGEPEATPSADLAPTATTGRARGGAAR